MKHKHKSDKSRLVKGYLPPTSRKLLEVSFFKKEIKEMLKENSGLYVLYKKGELYYVGITGNLFGRLNTHTKDKHKDKWDKFSVFIIGRGKYLKDIESMAQLISNPPANVWKGKFKKHYQYSDKIRSLIKDISKIIEDVKKESD